MAEWISVKDRLPEIIYGDDGGVNMVMVYLKNGFDGSGDIQIWNTVYLHNNKCNFTHWTPLPEPPKEKKK